MQEKFFESSTKNFEEISQNSFNAVVKVRYNLYNLFVYFHLNIFPYMCVYVVLVLFLNIPYVRVNILKGLSLFYF